MAFRMNGAMIIVQTFLFVHAILQAMITLHE